MNVDTANINLDHFLWLILGILIGTFIGILIFWIYYRFKKGGYLKISEEIITNANAEATAIRHRGEQSLRQSEIEQQRHFETLWHHEKRKLTREEERLKQREDKVEHRLQQAEKKLNEVERREAQLVEQQQQLKNATAEVKQLRQDLVNELEHHAGLSVNEARELLLERLTNDVRTDAANMVRRITKEAEEQAEDAARKIIVTAINRIAVPTVSDATVRTVPLPSEEMKGRIIGREGRNIRTLERTTGVNIIIDDTPGAIVVAGFDPLRLQVAKQALTELIADGRIHPTRIEEVVEKAHHDVIKKLRQYGEDAALRAGAINLHPELIMLLGKLRLRYSFGQNVLDHSLEVSHLMGLMAGELGLDIKLAKRIGLLHDIGKAVSHEVEGSHALIGHDLALKYGETIDVATGIGSHHFEMQPSSLEGVFCFAADAMSASRPGARLEAVEEYIKRLKNLEALAKGFSGVEKAYALQAGREVFVAVSPDTVDDAGVATMARELTKRIEKELSYPGKIKVTVVRERRSVEYAL
jgi:ribonuclease Y